MHAYATSGADDILGTVPTVTSGIQHQYEEAFSVTSQSMQQESMQQGQYSICVQYMNMHTPDSVLDEHVLVATTVPEQLTQSLTQKSTTARGRKKA